VDVALATFTVVELVTVAELSTAVVTVAVVPLLPVAVDRPAAVAVVLPPVVEAVVFSHVVREAVAAKVADD
jgi:hypothetical protein